MTVPDAPPNATATTEQGDDRTKTGVARSDVRERTRAPVDDVDRYEVQGEHARGGLGRVLRAVDRRLGRPVAIKELLRDGAGTERRFEREARITARLEHPAIVPVHDIGEWSTGKPFYAMKLVSGRTLKRAITDSESLADRLALLPHVLAVADAVAYAHSERIIHRDLKPSNVLIGAYGETVLIDWGLAKDLAAPSDSSEDHVEQPAGGDDELTKIGTVLGTPSYMAPEQAKGEPTDERSDVYALGAIVYTLLSGRAPYESTDSGKVLEAVRAGAPAPIGQVQPNVPSELAAIVDKAMARDPGDRYRNAGEMVRDLRSFQAGQLVAAHRYSVSELVRRWLQRHLRVLAVAAIVTLAGLSLFFVLRGGGDAGPSCDDFAYKLDGVWDQARREQVAAAFGRSERPVAADITAQVTERLDAYRDALLVMYSDTCTATHRRGEQSAELLDLRMACLDRRAAELGARVELFATSGHEPEVLYKAAEAIDALTSLDACTDAGALAAVTPLPENQDERAAVVRMQARLAEARANRDLGRLDDALPIADEVLASPAAASFAPLRAEALHERATIQGLRVELDDAIETMQHALETAARARDDHLVAEAWLGRMWLANEKAEFQRALDMRSGATAAVARAGDTVRQRGRLDRYLAIAMYRTRDLDGALALIDEALARFEGDPAHGPDHPQTASTLRIRANVLKRQTRFDDALADYQRALAIIESTYGKDHPEVINPLVSLANTYAVMSKLDEALEVAQRAVDVAENVYGPDSVKLEMPLGILGQVYYGMQDLDHATGVLERSLALAEKAYGDSHPEIAHILDNLGRIYGFQRKLEKARELLERSARITEATMGPDHPQLGHALSSVAESHMSMGEWKQAEALLHRAIAIFEKDGTDTAPIAWTNFILAHAVDGQGRHAEAVALVTAARETLASLGDRTAPQIAAIDDWLAKNR